MKNIIHTLLFAIFFAYSGISQNSIDLVINHKLDDKEFLFEEGTKNNLDHDFMVTRLEYYISEISIIHDGGQETAFDDIWVLANADNQTSVNLGEANIQHAEEIRFYIGVDPESNHLDPAAFPKDHPLAPKMPSMHWGWAAGYRFVAIEGFGGSNYDQVFQVHALGDTNYKQSKIEIDQEAVGGKLVVNLDANYSKSLDDTEVEWGLIEHSDKDEAITVIDNFVYNVFSISPKTSSSNDLLDIDQVNCYPNPSMDGNITLEFSSDLEKNYDIQVLDVLGNQILTRSKVKTRERIILENSGVYFLNISNKGNNILTKKLVVK